MSNNIKKTTVRIPEKFHKIIMKHLVDIDKSFNEYVLELIENDLYPDKKPVKGQTKLDDFL